MRIKKPHKKVNKDITFDTIQERNKAIKTLFDGDSVKVLDASNDPRIQSGWAIYRFCFETQTFDLVEKEEPEAEAKPTLKPDYKTTFLGAKLAGDEVNSLIVPAAHNWYDGIEFLQDFELLFSYQNGTRPLLRYTPVGIPNGEFSLRVPVNTKAGKKWMVIGAGACSFRFDETAKKAVWVVGAKLQDTDENAWASGSTWVRPDGTIVLPTAPTDGTTVGASIPFMIVSADLPKEGEAFNVFNVKTHCIWRAYLAPAAAPAEEVKHTALDNKTIIVDPAEKLAAFHNLNHGAGFEFPANIKMQFEPSGSTMSYNINWFGMQNGVDKFKHNNIEYPLGVRTKQVYSSEVRENVDTLGFTHYVRVSAHTGFVYWSSHVDYLSEMPTLDRFMYSGKEYVPLAIIKLVYTPEYKMDLPKCQVSHIYKNGLLIEPAPEAQKTAIDDRTIVLNSDKNICSFHDLNHGTGFEFPSNISAVMDYSSRTDNFALNWTGYTYGEGVYKYKNREYKLGLNSANFTPDFLLEQFNKFGGSFHYTLGAYLGTTYFPCLPLVTKELPSLEPFDWNGKMCIPILIVKFIFNADKTVNWEETQISRIYRNGALIEPEPIAAPTPETPDLQKVTDKGYETTNRIKLIRDGANSFALEIEDENGELKHSLNLLGFAGQHEMYYKDPIDGKNKIGISLNGMGMGYFDKQIITKALRISGGSPALGKIPICQDDKGNILWGDMPKAELPPIKHNYPDGLSCDYSTTTEEQHKFSVPDALVGFRSDMRILKDFDFTIGIDYKTIKFTPIGQSTQNIPVMTKDGQHVLQISPLSKVMESANQGKTIYIPVFKKVGATPLNDAYYLGNASQYNGVQGYNKGNLDQHQMIMQIRIDVPTDWNNFKHSDITVYKYWKKALATFDELMDYRIANP